MAAGGKEGDKAADTAKVNNTGSLELDRQLLVAFIDTIVPKDEGPGTVKAGVAD